MNTPSELSCQIIPTEGGNLLIPDRLVAEIVMLEENDTQQNLTWRNRTIPICQNSNNDKLTTRVTVLRTVMGYKNMPFIAIATDGIPHALQVNPESLTTIPAAEQTCQIAASYSRVGSLDCIIPDMPKIEAMMHEKFCETS